MRVLVKILAQLKLLRRCTPGVPPPRSWIQDYNSILCVVLMNLLVLLLNHGKHGLTSGEKSTSHSRWTYLNKDVLRLVGLSLAGEHLKKF